MGPLTYILWDVDPAIIEAFGRELRWYGLLFGMGLYLAIWLSHTMMRRDSLLPATASLDSLFFRIFLGTLLGARLGHVLFYDPAFYLTHPLEILYIHKGGLASHGGVGGVFIALWAYARRCKIPLAKLFDYASVALPLAFFFIRVANLAKLRNIRPHHDRTPRLCLLSIRKQANKKAPQSRKSVFFPHQPAA